MRTVEEINKDFGDAVGELGDLTYKLKFDIPYRIKQLEDKIGDLKHEHTLVTMETK